mmetsp:Transcript_11354/g.8953  ORF Transcript_11354/g.8953 Transcript_11354/m.8953 type:complete len:85 (-) Transcript_11354:37-291(-)
MASLLLLRTQQLCEEVELLLRLSECAWWPSIANDHGHASWLLLLETINLVILIRHGLIALPSCLRNKYCFRNGLSQNGYGPVAT